VEKVLMLDCGVCDRKYQHDAGRYDGHKLELYGGIFCCDTCWNGNANGWGPMLEPKLLKICIEKKIAIPCCNSDGWLPRN